MSLQVSKGEDLKGSEMVSCTLEGGHRDWARAGVVAGAIAQGMGQQAQVLQENGHFFYSPHRKTYCLCRHGRASCKGMAAVVHGIGATSRGARRTDFLTTCCGFEDEVASLLSGATD